MHKAALDDGAIANPKDAGEAATLADVDLLLYGGAGAGRAPTASLSNVIAERVAVDDVSAEVANAGTLADADLLDDASPAGAPTAANGLIAA